jgi:hypothetical protein
MSHLTVVSLPTAALIMYESGWREGRTPEQLGGGVPKHLTV